MKRIAAVCLIISLLLTLTGCGSSAAMSSANSERSAESTVIEDEEDEVKSTVEDREETESVVEDREETESVVEGEEETESAAEDGNTKSSSKNQISSQEEPDSNEPEGDLSAYTELNFGDMAQLDFVEITIDGANYGDEVKPDNPDSVYRYLSDVEGEKYFYIYGTIKNISGEKYEFAKNTYAAMMFDDKYNYDANVTADEGGDFSYIYANLDPLKSEKFYICASVPDELAETYSNFTVKFGFKNNFESEYGIQEDECDYLYSITVSR